MGLLSLEEQHYDGDEDEDEPELKLLIGILNQAMDAYYYSCFDLNSSDDAV